MTQLSTLGGNRRVQAYTLNNRGQVIRGGGDGRAETTSCRSARRRCNFKLTVAWGPKPGEIQVLPPLPGDTVGFALANNDRGQAVPARRAPAPTPISASSQIGPHAVIWTHGSPVALGTLGGYTASGRSLDQQPGRGSWGIFPGRREDLPFVRVELEETGMIDSGTIGGDQSAYPTMINDSGQTVGTSCDTDMSGNCRAYIWQYLGPGTAKEEAMRDLEYAGRPGVTLVPGLRVGDQQRGRDCRAGGRSANGRYACFSGDSDERRFKRGSGSAKA